jgi:hypothetical protein
VNLLYATYTGGRADGSMYDAQHGQGWLTLAITP